MADTPSRKPVKLSEDAEVSKTETQPAQEALQSLEIKNDELAIKEYETSYERRLKSLKYKLRGHSLQEIAERLGVSVSTVKLDLKKIKDENKELLSNEDKKSLISDILAGFDDVIERAWTEFEAAPVGSRHRLQSLDLVRMARNDKLKAFQETGIIEMQAQKVEQTVSFELIQNWETSVKKEIAQALIEHSLTKELSPPIKEDNIIDVVSETIVEDVLVKKDDESS